MPVCHKVPLSYSGYKTNMVDASSYKKSKERENGEREEKEREKLPPKKKQKKQKFFVVSVILF